MKFLVLLVLCATAVYSEKELSPEEATAFNYHGRFGLKIAEELWAKEAAMQAGRIVGGSAAPVGQHPYQAGLLISLLGTTGRSVCGAILIQNNRLLTAAHCWFDGSWQATAFEVILGTNLLFTGGVRITTSRVETHAEWNPRTITNDIAMISLTDAVSFTDLIRPVTLPYNYLNENFAGWPAVVSGFGRTSDSQTSIPSDAFVSYTDVNVITNLLCRLSFGTSILDSSICTSGSERKGPCSGDSGGPLVVNDNGEQVVVGIVSFGSGFGCQIGFPAAFARVTAFMPWITARL